MQRIPFVLVTFLCALLCGTGLGGATVIGIVMDGPSPDAEIWRQNFVSEITALTEGEFDVRFPVTALRIADWRLGGVEAALDELLADADVDLILTLGVLGSHAAASRGDLPKPVIAPYIIDAALQGLPTPGAGSGIRNLHFLDFPNNLTRDVMAFQEVVPFSRLALLGFRGFVEAIPHLAERAQRALAATGVEVEVIMVGDSVDAVLAALPATIEAVYLTPLLHLTSDEHDRLIAALNQRGLPTFSLLGEKAVERGVLMTLYPHENNVRKARRVALNTQRILLGDTPESIPTTFAGGERLILNMQTAAAIDLVPDWGVLTEAKRIAEDAVSQGRRLDLETAVAEAVRRNRDLAAAIEAVAVAESEVDRARSGLLPRIDLGALAIVIDEDRAGPLQAQRTFAASARLTQLLWSEPTRASLDIRRRQLDATVADRRRIELDIASLAAQAYLNVLRASTFERIQSENVKLSRSNLELARVRQSLGTARTAEVLRWESQIATNRRDAIAANSARNQAEIALNQVLHRPPEEPFQTAELGLDAETLLKPLEPLTNRFFSKRGFRALRAALVEDALAASPELAALDAAIAAQERRLSSRRASFWSPTLALQGEIDHDLAEGGSGADVPSGLDDTDWSLALSLSFPLFEGGDKFAARAGAAADLERLLRERESLQEVIEVRLRSRLHASGASFAGIREARSAAAAAGASLDLVQDAYSAGTADILDLLDAQNAALVTDEAAANAVYDFLLDLDAVDRALGRSWYLLTSQQREEFFRRLDRIQTTGP